MKEVFTKSFWEGVKKTFAEALEGPSPAASFLRLDPKRPGSPPCPAPGRLSAGPLPIEI
jgi:hypothetical protein